MIAILLFAMQILFIIMQPDQAGSIYVLTEMVDSKESKRERIQQSLLVWNKTSAVHQAGRYKEAQDFGLVKKMRGCHLSFHVVHFSRYVYTV